MKKYIMLIMVLLSLALFSAVMAADNYCTIDNYGCYVFNEDNQLTYIMFWSEAGRKAIMGDTGNPGDLVVDKPTFSSNRLPLGPFKEGVGSESAGALSDGARCVIAYHHFRSLEIAIDPDAPGWKDDKYPNGDTYDEDQCFSNDWPMDCRRCIYQQYLDYGNTTERYNTIFSGNPCNSVYSGPCGGE